MIARTRRLLVASALGALVTSVHAQSQEADPEAPTVEAALRPPAGITISLQGEQTYAFETDLRGVDAEVAIARTTGEVALAFPDLDRWRISLSLRGEFSSYDFSGDPLAPGIADDRFDDFWTAGVSLTALYDFENQWTAVLAGFGAASLEPGAEFTDAITAGGIAGLGYRFSDDLFIGAGVLVSTRLEDDVRVLPALQVNWRINDRLTFSTTGAGRPLTPITGGLGAQLAAAIDEPKAWHLVAFASYQGREYRLDDDGDALGEGVLRDDSFAVGLGVNWAPSRKVELALGGGAVVYREFELIDQGGHEVSDLESDAAPFLAARLTLRF